MRRHPPPASAKRSLPRCPFCGAEMRTSVQITDPAAVRDIIIHFGDSITLATIARPAAAHRCDSIPREDPSTQSPATHEVDPRII